MPDIDIKQISLHEGERTLSVSTFDGSYVVIGFRKDIYFDFVNALAGHQSFHRYFYKDPDYFNTIVSEILVRISNKLKSFSEENRKAYTYRGEIPAPQTWAKIWMQDFRTTRQRKHLLIKAKSPGLTGEELTEILRKLFSSTRRGKTTTYWLADTEDHPVVINTRKITPTTTLVDPWETPLGREKLRCIPLMTDIEDGFGPDDIKVTVLNERAPIPPELEEYRQGLFDRYRRAMEAGQDFPWPGLIYGVHEVSEATRDALTEKPQIHVVLRPTDYFSFKAIQDNLDNTILKDADDTPQTVRDRFLRDIDPFSVEPVCAQAISATVVLICKDDDGKEWTAVPKRSSRVETGRDVYVLSVNETLKREPTEQEILLLRDVPPEKLEYDPIAPPGPFFHAVVRGAREELGTTLTTDAIRFLCLIMEPARYQFALVGIAESKLTKQTVINNLFGAKDRRKEYHEVQWVPFTPEDIYSYMTTYRNWGSEAEIGLYLALCYKYRGKLDYIGRLFANYPNPIISV